MICGQPVHTLGGLEKRRDLEKQMARRRCPKPTAKLLTSCVGRSDKINIHRPSLSEAKGSRRWEIQTVRIAAPSKQNHPMFV